MSSYYEPASISAADQAKENKLVDLSLSRQPQPYLTGLKLKSDFEIRHAEDSTKKLVFNTIDSTTGVVWVLTDLEGWWMLPEVESLDLPRGWGDGSYDARGRYADRIMTLSGSFLTQDSGQVAKARDKLVQAISWMHDGAWLIVREKVADSTPTTYDKAVWVRLSDTPMIQNVSARGRTDFSIGIKAVDPIKYELVDNDIYALNSIDIPMGGSATVTNAGNTKVSVIFEVVGPLTASPSAPVSIKLTSAEPNKVINIVLSQSVSTDRLNIDTYKREVLFNDQGYETNVGAARRRVNTLVDWIELVPGANIINFTGSGTATCTVLFRSGWIG